MNILILSSPSIHKAGKVSYELKNDLESKGNNLQILTLDNFKKRLASKLIVKIKKKLTIKNKTDKNYYFFDFNDTKQYFSTKQISKKIRIKPDIIIISFYHKFLTSKNFKDLQEKYNAKLLFWMMDMALFTGGCHYANTCSLYKNSCGNCPALYSKKHKDQSYINLLNKKHVFSNLNYECISISTEQYNQAKNSTLLKNSTVHKVLHSIDLNVFKQVDDNQRLKNRKKYNIEEHEITFLFIATDIYEKRKGFDDIVNALTNISEDINLFIIGNYKNKKVDFGNTNVKYFGAINDLTQIAEIYSSCDVLLNLTHYDSGPLTIMESMACGTPVISYNVGVSNDIIIEGENGYLVDNFDIKNLEKKILSFIKTYNKDMRKFTHAYAIKHFSPERRTNDFIKILKKRTSN